MPKLHLKPKNMRFRCKNVIKMLSAKLKAPKNGAFGMIGAAYGTPGHMFSRVMWCCKTL